jgi:hypothetical protein
MFNLSQISSSFEIDKEFTKSIEKSPPAVNNGGSKKNRTLKRRLVKSDLDTESSQPLTPDIYNSLDESNLAEFPPKPQSTGVERRTEGEIEEDTAVSKQDYKLLGAGSEENEYQEKAYQQYLATHQQWSPLLTQSRATAQDRLQQNIQESPVKVSDEENKALMKKLNYMIHLLEEQQNEKTNNLTEELILYIFLGIFVIFVVDSFTKVGKYTR